MAIQVTYYANEFMEYDSITDAGSLLTEAVRPAALLPLPDV